MKEYIFEQKKIEEENYKIAENKKLKLKYKDAKKQLEKIQNYGLGDFDKKDEWLDHKIFKGIDPTLKGNSLKKALRDKWGGLIEMRDDPKNWAMEDEYYIPESKERFLIHYKRLSKKVRDYIEIHF